jgi:hypothetical protein
VRKHALLGLTVSLALAGCGSSPSTSSTSGTGGVAGSATGGQGTGGRNAEGGTGGTAIPGTGGAAGAGATAGPGPGTAGAGGAAGTGGGAGTRGSGGGGAGGAHTGAAGGGGSRAGGRGAAGCPGLVCEDFESGAIDAQKWDTLTSGGTASVQTQQVAHGTYALRLHGLGSGSDDWAILVAKNVPAALKGTTTFGRMNVYWGAEAAVSLHAQFPFAGSNGPGTGGVGPAPFPKLRYLEIGSYFGGWQLGMDLLDVSPTVEVVSHPSGKWPTNKWFCMEWEFEDQPDRITLWVDGTQVGTMDSTNAGSNGALYQGKNSGIIGAFDTFGVGFHDWHPAKVFDVYYDDVVLDAKRIGCAK